MIYSLLIVYHFAAQLAEMELHGALDAKDEELQSFDFGRTLSQDHAYVDGIKNDERQPDALTRLGKLPVLKVSSQFLPWEGICRPDPS